jgi:hypothetical protein
MPSLVNVIGIANNEPVDTGWRCSECGKYFSVEHLPQLPDDRLYKLDLAGVNRGFVEHCESEHEALSVAPLPIDMPAPGDNSSEVRDADFVLEEALLLASFGSSFRS